MEDLVLSGQQLETVQCCHGPDVVYAVLDDNGQSPPSHQFPFQGKCFAYAIGADPLLVPGLRLAQKWTNHHRGRMVKPSGETILAQMAGGGLSASCRLVIAPKLRHLSNSYLIGKPLLPSSRPFWAPGDFRF